MRSVVQLYPGPYNSSRPLRLVRSGLFCIRAGQRTPDVGIVHHTAAAPGCPRRHASQRRRAGAAPRPHAVGLLRRHACTARGMPGALAVHSAVQAPRIRGAGRSLSAYRSQTGSSRQAPNAGEVLVGAQYYSAGLPSASATFTRVASGRVVRSCHVKRRTRIPAAPRVLSR